MSLGPVSTEGKKRKQTWAVGESLKFLYYKNYTIIAENLENKEKPKEAKVPPNPNLLIEEYVLYVLM